MENYGHLLTHYGVLTTFSVSKKINQKDIDTFIKKQKQKGKSDDEIDVLLNDKILSDIDVALKDKKIPGIVTPLDILNDMFDKNKNKNIKELSTVADSTIQTIGKKTYTNVELCYFINCLITHLNLKDVDFKHFHQLMNKYNSQADDFSDDEDEEDEEDDFNDENE